MKERESLNTQADFIRAKLFLWKNILTILKNNHFDVIMTLAKRGNVVVLIFSNVVK